MLIVTYHAIGDVRSPVTTTLAALERDLQGLGDLGYVFASLDACADWLQGTRPLPSRAAAVTFDDGYDSVARLAMPLLARLAVPATVFVIAGRVGGDNRWEGQWPAVPSGRLLDRAALIDLQQAGWSIGAHTWTHRRLTDLDAAALDREVVAAADHLEQLVAAPVRHFAYPYGARGAREVDAAVCRYRTASSTRSAVVTRADVPHDLPRIDPHDLALGLRTGAVRLESLTPPYLAARRTLRAVRRRVERFVERRKT